MNIEARMKCGCPIEILKVEPDEIEDTELVLRVTMREPCGRFTCPNDPHAGADFL